MGKANKTIKKPAYTTLSKYLAQKLVGEKELAKRMEILEEIMRKNRESLKKLAE